MGLKTSIVAGVACAALAGCTTWQPATYKKSSVNLGGDKPSQGGMVVWDSSLSAAVFVPGERTFRADGTTVASETEPKMCAQAARVAREGEARTQASSEALAALASGPFTAAAQEADTAQDAVNIVGGINETVEKLIATSESVTYLDTGMFYLCQISANADMDDATIAEIAKALFTSATQIGAGQSSPQTPPATAPGTPPQRTGTASRP